MGQDFAKSPGPPSTVLSRYFTLTYAVMITCVVC